VRRPLFALGLLALLSGCGGGGIGHAQGPDSACVYGSIVVDENDVPNAVIMHELGVVYAPPFASPPTATTFTDGTFFFDNVKPGRYYLARFMVGQDMFAFAATTEKALEPMLFVVAPGEAHYMGSFHAKTGVGSIFSPSFDFPRVDHPDAPAVLKSLSPHLAGTGWERILAPQQAATN